MCKSRHEITTKSGSKLYVNCGKCDACRQEKAQYRAKLIRDNNITDAKYITLFLTLTYSNSFIPYIRKSEIVQDVYTQKTVVPVYRDKDIRRVRVNIDGKFGYAYKARKCGFLRNIEFAENYYAEDVDKLKSLVNGSSDKVGVIYYKDIQDFFKRLNINLLRKYDIVPDYSFFAVAEMGPTTLRPHFHVLIRIPKEQEKIYRYAVVSSWRYSDIQRLEKYMFVAFDGSSYVSSYVNSHNYIPKILQEKEIMPKCTHSKHYGFNHVGYSLDKVVEASDKRDFSISNVVFIKRDPVQYRTSIPSYVIDYWFPKIQGFSKLSFNELVEVYECPKRLAKYARKLGYKDTSIKDSDIFKRYKSYDLDVFTMDDIQLRNFLDKEAECVKKHALLRNIKRLYNALDRYYKHYAIPEPKDRTSEDYKRWLVEFELLSTEFAHRAIRTWISYKSYKLLKMYDIPLTSRYENVGYFVNNPDISPSLRAYVKQNKMDIYDFERDVNKNSFNDKKEQYLLELFRKKDKSKKVKSAIYCQLNNQL